MPIYEYKCSRCGNVAEEFSTIVHDRPVFFTPCTPCGDVWSRRKHHRIMSKSTFKLAGMGWAIDGYDKNAPHRVVEIDEPSVI